MSNPEVNWEDPASVEAILRQEGLGDIDTVDDPTVVHIGVGRAAMVAASGNVQDVHDFKEDNLQVVDLDEILGE